MLRGRFHKRRRDLAQEDLNLTPFIDVFVTLIVFVLLSAVFVRLGTLSFKTPGLSSAEGPAMAEVKRELSLLVKVENAQIITSAYDSARGSELLEYKKAFPIQQIQDFKNFLSALKQKEGGLTRTLLRVAPSMTYQLAVQVLETIENSNLSADVILAAGAEGEIK